MTIINIRVFIASIALLLAGVLLTGWPVFSQAEHQPAYISIIIDDLGYKSTQDFRVIDLPAPIICAIMPHAPLSDKLAIEAHRSGKEVILHIPMESQHQHHRLGPGGLRVSMNKHEFISTLRNTLNSMPLAIGMNNHMGSRLTTHHEHMHWLMDELKDQGFAYIDSMTTNRSVANSVAHEKQVPYLVRDIFIDHEVNPRHIQQQLKQLIRKAKTKGYATAIGHPHPQTLDAIEQFLLELRHHNIQVVSLTEMLQLRNHAISLVRTSALSKPITAQTTN